MDPKIFRRALIVVGLTLCGLLSHAQVTSTFDEGTDGWTLINDGDDDTLVISHNATGGLTGGHISADVPADTYPGFFWYAPAKYRGNLAYSSLGMTLTWSQQQLVTGNNSEFNGNYYEIYSPDVVISSGNNSIYFHTSPKPELKPGWSTYSVTLDETSAWRTGAYVSSPLATRAQIKAALYNVSEFTIRGNFNLTANTIGLDDVSMGVHPVFPPPTITNVTPLSGLPGSTVTIMGVNFNTTPSNMAVNFGAVQANILTSSATQLTVEVPSGAQVNYITVSNLVTGLSGNSLQKFTPMFEGGGRIIRASFKPTFYYNMDPSGGDVRAQLGDIDGDGWVDIVVSENSLSTISVLRNLGTGGTITAASFAPKVSVSGAGEILLADFNADGKLDIGCQLGGFSFYTNTSVPGTISFDPTPATLGGIGNVGGIHAADIDGDGKPEFLATQANGSVAADFFIAQNISRDGRIDFAPILSYFGGSILDAAGPINTGDLDGDGKTEITVVSSFGGRFHIIKNTSTPGIISLQTPFLANNASTKDVVIADLDGDGKNDLAWTADPGGSDIIIRRNIYSAGVFDMTAFDTSVGITAPISYINGGLTPADINGDGRIDLVQGGTSDNVVFENISTPGSITSNSFAAGIPYRGSDASYSSGPVIGDLNGDDKPEILFGSMNNTPRIFLYENQNIHGPHISLNTVSPLKGPVGSTVTITGDNFSATPTDNIVRFGAVTAVVLSATENLLTVEVPPGATYAPVSVTRDFLTSRYHLPFSPTFGPGATFDATSFSAAVNFTLTSADYDIEIGDIDNDGLPDVVAEGGLARILQNTHSSGAISTASLTSAGATNVNVTNPRLVDIDEDGKLDIVGDSGIGRNTSTTSISFDNMATSFANGASTASWADFDRDGKTDMVSPGGGANVSLFYNWSRGGIPFVAIGANYLDPISDAISVAKTGAGGSVAVGDFDNDGFSEFAATSGTTDHLRIWKNNGSLDPSFAVVTDLLVGDNPGRLYSGDLDADGKLDLALYHGAGTASGIITVLHNESTAGSITFSQHDYTIGSVGTTMTIADVDGDGKPEIIVAGEADNRVSIFKNTSTPGTLDASSFAAPFHYTVNGARAIAVGDLNLDGKPELVVTRAGNLLSVLENAVPVGPVITIASQPTFTYACEGSSATFNVDASGTTNITYQWQFDSGSGFADLTDENGYSGTGTKTLSINTSVTGFSGNGEYRCRINGDLATEVFSDDAQLTINGLPSPPDVSGDTKCTSPATLTITATGGSDGDYNWYDVAAGGSVLGTAGSFTTPSLTSTKTYYVSIEDTFCESDRVAVDATISLLTKPTINSSEPVVSSGVNICDGENCTLTAPDGFSTYTWSNGDTGQAISVDQPGVYSVIVGNAGCVSPASDPVTVIVNPYPVATIDVNGALLAASPADSYQWYQNGTPVTSATSQTFEFNVLEYGVYAVDVTENGCTTTSDDFTYLITGTEITNEAWKVYPNPFTTTLTIESPASQHNEVDMIDLLGRSVKKFSFQKQHVLATDELSQGVYHLIIKTKNGIFRIKLVKSH